MAEIESEFEGGLDGTVEAVFIEDTPRVRETNIIFTDEQWHAHVTWDVHGPLVNAPLDPSEWRLQMYLESIGPGPELSLPADFVKIPFVRYQTHYEADINVAPSTVLQGGYKPTIVLYFYNGGTPWGIGGFVEPGMLLFHDK